MRFNALWWWIDRWRKSTAYMDMTLEQQGLHRELVGAAFLRHGWLPNDPVVLCRAVGATANEWRRCWPAVSRFWVQAGDRLLPGPEVRLYVSRFRRLPPLVARSRRPEIPQSVRRSVFRRDDGRCVQCYRDDKIEFDHILRWRDGGQHTEENLRLLCRQCNRARG